MDIFHKRRQQLMQSLPQNSVVILATNQQQQRNDDVNFIFRPHSSFYYLSGFCEPNSVIVLDDNYTIFLQDSNPKREIWDGKRLGVKAAKQTLLADNALPITTLKDKIVKLIKDKTVYFDFDNLSLDIIKIVAKGSYASLKDKIATLRLIKDEVDITNIKSAINISQKAHIQAMQNAHQCEFEYQLSSIFDSTFSYHNTTHAYPPIVASGENALTLHYIENKQKLKNGDLVLIDAGCEYHFYASDITRTFPINGKFNEAQKQIYRIVLTANKEAIKSVEVGKPVDTPHKVANKVITQGLNQLGLLQHHKVTDFFMHGTSHYLGLDVHDCGDYKINDKYRVFEAGMVITIEPGIYLKKSDKIHKKYHNIGIRIEDNILVTLNGGEVLTKDIPKEIEEIEEIML